MHITGVFFAGQEIPRQHTCDGTNLITPVTVTGVPPSAKSLVLIMDDPDIPEFVKQKFGILVYDHWVLFNISPMVKIIDGKNGVHGKNSSGKNAYIGPCPPDRQHRYFYKVFALDCLLSLKEGATKEEVLLAMKGHVIAQTELMGTYERETK